MQDFLRSRANRVFWSFSQLYPTLKNRFSKQGNDVKTMGKRPLHIGKNWSDKLGVQIACELSLKNVSALNKKTLWIPTS